MKKSDVNLSKKRSLEIANDLLDVFRKVFSIIPFRLAVVADDVDKIIQYEVTLTEKNTTISHKTLPAPEKEYCTSNTYILHY